ncbi:hypothetical protein N431DRAFT_4629 [Stipitochalara longipes BDJ]|nr:hypothetical protein N431DRAFT_4629 [Stipitochalara longipes BDJ]
MRYIICLSILSRQEHWISARSKTGARLHEITETWMWAGTQRGERECDMVRESALEQIDLSRYSAAELRQIIAKRVGGSSSAGRFAFARFAQTKAPSREGCGIAPSAATQQWVSSDARLQGRHCVMQAIGHDVWVTRPYQYIARVALCWLSPSAEAEGSNCLFGL